MARFWRADTGAASMSWEMSTSRVGATMCIPLEGGNLGG
jgi:hypothetical protein